MINSKELKRIVNAIDDGFEMADYWNRESITQEGAQAARELIRSVKDGDVVINVDDLIDWLDEQVADIGMRNMCDNKKVRAERIGYNSGMLDVLDLVKNKLKEG